MKAIETKGLTKFYGKARGIEDLNLTVEEGEIFGFIGPNGAGKSTTIRTLLGLIRKTSGSASVKGSVAVKYMPIRPAAIKTSPCAKLIRRRMP